MKYLIKILNEFENYFKYWLSENNRNKFWDTTNSTKDYLVDTLYIKILEINIQK